MFSKRKTFVMLKAWKCLKFSAVKWFPELHRIHCSPKIFLFANPTSVKIHFCMNSYVSSKSNVCFIVEVLKVCFMNFICVTLREVPKNGFLTIISWSSVFMFHLGS